MSPGEPTASSVTCIRSQAAPTEARGQASPQLASHRRCLPERRQRSQASEPRRSTRRGRIVPAMGRLGPPVILRAARPLYCAGEVAVSSDGSCALAHFEERALALVTREPERAPLWRIASARHRRGCFTSDGTHAVLESADGIEILDARAGARARALPREEYPFADTLVEGLASRQLSWRALSSPRFSPMLATHRFLAATPDASLLLASSRSGAIELWHETRGHVLSIPADFERAPSRLLRLSPEGSRLAVRATSKAAEIRSLPDLSVEAVLVDASRDVTAMCFSPDGDFLLVGSVDGRVSLHDLRPRPVSEGGQARGARLARFAVWTAAAERGGKILDCGFAGDGTPWAIGRTYTAFDRATGQVLRERCWPPGLEGGIFRPDGQACVGGSPDSRTLLLREPGPRTIELARLRPPLALSPDGAWLLARQGDGSLVRLCVDDSSRPPVRLRGPGASSAVLAASGVAYLALEDGGLEARGPQGELIAASPREGGPAGSLALSRDGQSLALIDDSALEIWQTSPLALRARAPFSSCDPLDVHAPSHVCFTAGAEAQVAGWGEDDAPLGVYRWTESSFRAVAAGRLRGSAVIALAGGRVLSQEEGGGRVLLESLDGLEEPLPVPCARTDIARGALSADGRVIALTTGAGEALVFGARGG